MNNPFFSMFGDRNNQGNNNNILNLVQQFRQFQNSFQGSPIQAQQQVQEMLDSGKISQNQFNHYANVANQIIKFMEMR